MRSFELSSFLALAVTKKQKNVCNCAGCEGIFYQMISLEYVKIYYKMPRQK